MIVTMTMIMTNYEDMKTMVRMIMTTMMQMTAVSKASTMIPRP